MLLQLLFSPINVKYTFSERVQTAELVSNFWSILVFNLHILYTNNLLVCQLTAQNGGDPTPRSLLTSMPLRLVCANRLDGIY